MLNIILLDRLLFKLGSGKGGVGSLEVSGVSILYHCCSSRSG